MHQHSRTSIYLDLNSQLSISRDALNLGKVPFLVAERTDGSCFQPTLDAIQVKDVSAISKGNGETVVVGWTGIGLILDRRLVEGVAANGALSIRKSG